MMTPMLEQSTSTGPKAASSTNISKTAGGRCWSKTALPHASYAPSTDKKVEESPAHFLGECKALEKVWEEALLRSTNNLDQHFNPCTSITIGTEILLASGATMNLLPFSKGYKI